MVVKIDDIDPFSWASISLLRGRCEKQAADEGLAGVELFFRSQALFTDALGQFPTMKERQANVKRSAKSIDPAVAALIEIRDGHNDPRALAADVLQKMGVTPST